MAVGWKSLTGIVGAASIVSVGTLYSVLVREPVVTAPSPSQTNTATDSKPAAPVAATTPSAADAPPKQSAQPAPASQTPAQPATQEQAAAKPDTPKAEPSKPDTAKGAAPNGEAAKPEVAKPQADANATPDAQMKTDAAAADSSKAAKGQVFPTFDVARIEPGGDAVIAGRAAPGATVELLRNGISYARAVADVGGQWAIVPPALPKGPCELTLRTTSPDGHTAQSEQTISVRVPEKPGEDVIVVLNMPDQPSKVLTDATRPASRPVANAQVAAAPPTQAAPPGNGPTVATPSAPTPSTPKTDAGNTPSRANASIRTVEADETGRFFVTGMAEPGASLRIYLNDTLVASVTAAKDGGFGLTIEKGMQPGDYHVRVDDVATATGQVLTRAEVPFAMTGKSQTASIPAVVAAATTSAASKSNLSAATPQQPGTPATRDASGSATPQQTQPASVQAPPAASSTGVPVASATDAATTQGQAEPAATAVPAQGASPATGQQSDASATAPAPASGATPASSGQAKTPPAAGQATPGAAAVQVGEAKPAAPTPPPSVAVIPEIRTTTIVQGDNLWRISRKAYGQGMRYTWIYDANTDQIRNPNLIYPGQIFVMPEKKTP